MYYQYITRLLCPFLCPRSMTSAFCVILCRTTERAGAMPAGCRLFRLDFAGGGAYNSGISTPYFYPSGGRKAPGGFLCLYSWQPSSLYTELSRAACIHHPAKRQTLTQGILTRFLLLRVLCFSYARMCISFQKIVYLLSCVLIVNKLSGRQGLSTIIYRPFEHIDNKHFAFSTVCLPAKYRMSTELILRHHRGISGLRE